MNSIKIIICLTFFCLNLSAQISTNDEINLARAQIAHNGNNWTKALTFLNHILKGKSPNLEALFLKAQILNENQNYMAAAKIYEQTLKEKLPQEKKKKKLSPEILQIVYALAQTYYAVFSDPNRNEYAKELVYQKAIPLFKMCIREEFNVKSSSFHLGHMYYLSSKLQLALKYFQKTYDFVKGEEVSELKIITKFYLGITLIPLGHFKEAQLYLLDVIKLLKSKENPLRDQILASTVATVKSLVGANFTGALSVSQSLTDNATNSTKDTVKIEPDFFKSSSTNIRTNLNYRTNSLNKIIAEFNVLAQQLRNDHNRFATESYRSFNVNNSLIYQKFNGEYWSMRFGFADFMSGENTSGKTDYSNFSKTYIIGPGYQKINRYGFFSLQLPTEVIQYRDNIDPTDRNYSLSISQKFYPFNSYLQPTVDLRVGYNNSGKQIFDGKKAKILIDNSISHKNMLFQQNFYYEYVAYDNSSNNSKYWGLSLQNFFFLPTRPTIALNVGATYNQENHFFSTKSTIRKFTYKVGIELYF